jgi:cytoplasmic iron level regulating protein YaaA (DUF328/UPF0246 family)
MNWKSPTKPSIVSRQAIYAFKGDVYMGLEANSLTKREINYAQKHLGILSGLYGILRPLDLMQAYRLEMGCRLQSSKGKNLYDFWGSCLTDGLNKLMGEQDTDVIINCASNEYFKSINVNDLKGRVITPVFKIVRDGLAKSPGMVIKRARGMMARYIIQKRISNVEGLKEFKMDGYKFMPTLSNDENYEFHKIVD